MKHSFSMLLIGFVLLGLILVGCSDPETTTEPAAATQVELATDVQVVTAAPTAGSVAPTASLVATTAPTPLPIADLMVISPENATQLARLVTLTGHTDRVTDLAFSPDGAYLASVSWDHTIRIWDAVSGLEVRSFPIQKPDLNVIAFAPNGHLLASAWVIWDVETGQQAHTLVQDVQNSGHQEPIHLAFSPDGSLIATVTFGQPVNLWDIASAKIVREFEMPGEVRGHFGIVFSPDGKRLAGGADNGTVTIWDVATGEIADNFEHGDTSDVHDLAYTPDGSMLAAGGTGYAIRVWDAASGKGLHRLSINNGIYGLAFSPDGSILATASCSRVSQLWDMQTGMKLTSLPHADELMAVAFSPDGKLLAAGGYDNTIVVWGIPK